MKKLGKMLMLIAMLLVSVNVFAYDFEVGGIYYNILTESEGNQVEVTFGNEEANSYAVEEIAIPEKVEYEGVEYAVTAIGQAFQGCDKILSVELPNTITTIDAMAFYNCSNLATINIPASVQVVGKMVFAGCSKLKEVHISDLSAWCQIKVDGYSKANDGLLGNGSNIFLNGEMITNLAIPNDIEVVNSCAFACSPGIVSVAIGDNVAFIGSYAFANCSNLKEITVSGDLESLGVAVFYGSEWFELQNDGPVYVGNILCDYKGEVPTDCDLQIKDGTKSVAPQVFFNNSDLRSIYIPASVEDIGQQAFSACINLEEINVDPANGKYCSIDGVLFDKLSKQLIIYPAQKHGENYQVPEWVTDIYLQAFGYVRDLRSVSMGDNVVSIGMQAFWQCMELSSIRLSENLQKIGDGAFGGCYYLESISFPKNVASIGAEAFMGCLNLNAIYSYNPVPPTCIIGEDAFGWEMLYPFADDVYGNACLYVPSGTASLYGEAQGWNKFENIVEIEKGSVGTVGVEDVVVVAKNGRIVVDGFDGNGAVEVYGVSGQLVYSGTDTLISVPTRGIYIVRVAGQTFKVIL